MFRRLRRGAMDFRDTEAAFWSGGISNLLFLRHLASNGAEAVAFRQQRIEPLLAEGAAVTLDFTVVARPTSSFVNALVTGLVEENGEAVLSKVVFKERNPMLQVLVESAIHLGLCKRQERLLA